MTFGALVLIATLAVLVVVGAVAARSTDQLLQTRARMIIDAMQLRVERELQEPVRQLEAIASLVEDGYVDPDDRTDIARLLHAFIVTEPTLTALYYIRPDDEGAGAWRDADGRVQFGLFSIDAVNADSAALDELRSVGRATTWGTPFRPQGFGSALPVGRGIELDGEIVAHVAAFVTVRQLSAELPRLATFRGQEPFVLYGDQRVFAHRALREPADEAEGGWVLPTVASFSDPILRAIWSAPRPERDGGQVEARSAVVDGVRYVYLYARLSDIGLPPLVVGAYFQRSDVAFEIDRLVGGLVAGLVSAVVAVVIAFVLGRLFARGVQRLAAAAVAAGRFDFRATSALPASRLREIDDAATAFRSMGHALEQAARFLPRRLVMQLLQPALGRAPFETRELTILFSDLTGFTRLSENLTAAATARLLNDHLDIVARAIEAEGGTVDKFLGDGVMAFWGAPDPARDHAERALRAAAGIATSFAAANARAATPLRLRVGVHTGRVVVGEIGGGSRVNYTIVGDPVNTASRLCDLGKDVAPLAETIVLVSGDTLRAASGSWTLHAKGTFVLPGRLAELDVWELQA
ncbi:MAG: adenylate/guanylate cyclase domain-containing protein [Pseudomonadota bacterium]